MAIHRYDHRKLAIERRKNRKKKKDSQSSPDNEYTPFSDNDEETLGQRRPSNLQNEQSRSEPKWRRVAFEKHQGGKGIDPSNTPRDGRRMSFNPRLSTAEGRRESLSKKGRRKSIFDKKNASDAFYTECMEMLSKISEQDISAEVPGREVDEFTEIMQHLEMKQKSREKDKTVEEYMEIKSRMTGIMYDFDKPSEDDEICAVTVSEESLKTNDQIKKDIFTLIKIYEDVCKKRETILMNVHTDLSIEVEFTAERQNDGVNDNDKSEEILQTMKSMGQKTQKLRVLHDKLINLSKHGQGRVTTKSDIEGELREAQLQKSVVDQFKKLQDDKSNRKEKLDTWKYAATEIVDLLQSVRSEGATDIERLEMEFSKLVQAFKAQSELAEDFQLKLETQKKIIQQSENEKKKALQETILLQDECDKYQVKLKTFEIKCTNLETQLKKNQSSGNAANPIESVSIAAMNKKIIELEEELKYHKEQEKISKSKKQEEKQIKNESNYQSPRKISETISAAKDECLECEKRELEIVKLNEIDVERKTEISLLKEKVDQMLKEHSNEKYNKPGIGNDILIESSLRQESETLENKKPPSPNLLDSNSSDDNNANSSPVSENPKEIVSSDKYVQVDLPLKSGISTSNNICTNCSGSGEKVDPQIQNASQNSSLGQIVEKEFSGMATKILGYVKVVSSLSNSGPNTIKEESKILGNENGDKAFLQSSLVSPLSGNEGKGKNQDMENRKTGTGKTNSEIEKEEQNTDMGKKGNDSQKRLLSKDDDSSRSYVNESFVSQNDSAIGDEENIRGQNSLLKDSSKSNFSTLQHISRRYSLPGEQQVQPESMIFSRRESLYLNPEPINMERNWQESGFFEDSKVHLIKSDESDKTVTPVISNNQKKGWEAVKFGKCSQVIRFLQSVGSSKCSHLSEKLQIKNANEPVDVALSNKLQVYAAHAIDLLDIIAFAVKQIDLSGNNGLEKDESPKKGIPTVNEIREAWGPGESPQKETNKLSTLLTSRRPSAMPPFSPPTRGDSFFPMIAPNNESSLSPQRRVTLAQQRHDSQQFGMNEAKSGPFEPNQNHVDENKAHAPTLSNQDKLAKIAEKKRLKILERHKRLVQRLKAGGASTKQIYAILGITKKTEDDVLEEDNKMFDHERRVTRAVLPPPKKMSIVGNSLNQQRNHFGPTIGFPDHRASQREGPRNHFGPTIGFPDQRASQREGPRRNEEMTWNSIGRQNKVFLQGSSTSGASRPPNTVFPPLQQQIQNRNMGTSFGITPQSMNFFKTKPIGNAKKR